MRDAVWGLRMHYQSGFDAPVGETSGLDVPVARGSVPRDLSRTVFYRSAGACPPRALEYADNGEGQALALR